MTAIKAGPPASSPARRHCDCGPFNCAHGVGRAPKGVPRVPGRLLPLLKLPMALLVLAGTLFADPPSVECTVGGGFAGSCRMVGIGAGARSVASSEASLTLIGRRAARWPGWYLAGGLIAEEYRFTGDLDWPRRLQDLAAPLRLEYFRGDEQVAQLSVQPGLYFEDHASGGAWDAPVQLVSGIPIAGALSGVAGFNNGRFFHHPLPIFGVVWGPAGALRWELLFPEPALVYSPGRGQQWRLGGELDGGGFLGDARPGRTVVEYSSYRVGLEWSRTWLEGARVSLGAGVEVARTFDYFRAGQRLHGGGAGYVEATFARTR